MDIAIDKDLVETLKPRTELEEERLAKAELRHAFAVNQFRIIGHCVSDFTPFKATFGDIYILKIEVDEYDYTEPLEVMFFVKNRYQVPFNTNPQGNLVMVKGMIHYDVEWGIYLMATDIAILSEKIREPSITQTDYEYLAHGIIYDDGRNNKTKVDAYGHAVPYKDKEFKDKIEHDEKVTNKIEEILETERNKKK